LPYLELYCPVGGRTDSPHFKLHPCLYYQTIFSKSGSKRKWHRIIWKALINTVHCLKATALQNECESHFYPTNHTVGTDYVMLFTANPSPRRDPPCIIRKELLSRRFSPSTELTSMRYVGHNNHTTSVQLTGRPKLSYPSLCFYTRVIIRTASKCANSYRSFCSLLSRHLQVFWLKPCPPSQFTINVLTFRSTLNNFYIWISVFNTSTTCVLLLVLSCFLCNCCWLAVCIVVVVLFVFVILCVHCCCCCFFLL